jgi:predicted Zn-dependent protease
MYANKVQLNKWLCEQILNDNDFFNNAILAHHLVVTREYAVLTQVFKWQKVINVELASKYEVADVIMTRQAIFIGQDPQARVCVMNIFALLLHHYAAQILQCSMTVQSLIHD